MQGTTAELLRDIITIFYAPLAQVYRAASIADSIGDLQTFINDLIRTVEQTEECECFRIFFGSLVLMTCTPVSQTDPAKTVQIFIDLVQRHEQSFYNFVHKVHSKGEGLFTSLMRWIELFLTLLRDGAGERMSLEFLLPHTGAERADILREVDAIALYHYKLKVAYEAKLRKRFGRTQGMGDADAEDEATAQLVNGVVRDLSFGDVVEGDANDLAAQEADEDDEDSSDEYESGSGSGTSSEGSSDEEDDSDEDEDDEDDSDGSSDGADTERDGTPHPRHASLSNWPPAPIQIPTRAHTVAHSISRQRPSPSPSPSPSSSSRPSPSPSRPFHSPSHLAHAVRHSADSPRDERPLVPSPLRERARTLSTPGRPPSAASRFKDLPPPPVAKDLPPPPPPQSSRQQQKRADRGPPPARAAAAPPPPKAKKAAEGPKPPDLEHIPKLLPLFVEMVRVPFAFYLESPAHSNRVNSQMRPNLMVQR